MFHIELCRWDDALKDHVCRKFGPKGRYSRPFVYRDKDDALTAQQAAVTALRLAGVEETFQVMIRPVA